MKLQPLGRKVPKDFVHVEKYRFSAAPQLVTKPAPIQLGINWYTDFDRPVKKGRYWWIGLNPNNLGSIRGGHSLCAPHDYKLDTYAWYLWYNQINEGKCVGEGGCRMMSIENRITYDPTWLWNEAKKIDEWPDTNPGDNEGTSVRAAMDVVRTVGLVRKGEKTPRPEDGILANRWATTVDECLSVWLNPKFQAEGYCDLLNSWGRFNAKTGAGYPHVVRMPLETLHRLLKEDGEATMITDK
jgi:hypothetical protein